METIRGLGDRLEGRDPAAPRARVESISTAIRRPDATPETDVDVIEASLTFEVRK